MEPTNKTYPIKTIEDLFAVPAARREICLLEIAVALEQAERAAAAVKAKIQAMHFPTGLQWLKRWILRRIKPAIMSLDWVDDGKFTATFSLLHGKTRTTYHSPDWRTTPAAKTAT